MQAGPVRGVVWRPRQDMHPWMPLGGHPLQILGLIHPQPHLMPQPRQVTGQAPAHTEVAVVVDHAAKHVPQHGGLGWPRAERSNQYVELRGLGAGAGEDLGEALAGEGADDGAANHAAMAGDEDFRVGCHSMELTTEDTEGTEEILLTTGRGCRLRE